MQGTFGEKRVDPLGQSGCAASCSLLLICVSVSCFVSIVASGIMDLPLLGCISIILANVGNFELHYRYPFLGILAHC